MALYTPAQSFYTMRHNRSLLNHKIRNYIFRVRRDAQWTEWLPLRRYSPGRCEWGNLGNWLNQLIIIFGRHVRVAIKSICWSFRRRRLPTPSIQKHRHHPSTYHPATPTGWEIIIQVGLLALLLKSSLPAIQHYCRFPLTVLASFPVARTRGDDDDDGGGGEGDDDCYNQAQSFHLCISTWGYYWQFCSGKLLFTICPFPLVALPPPYHPLSRSNLNSIPILQCSPCIVLQFPRGRDFFGICPTNHSSLAILFEALALGGECLALPHQSK